MRVLSVSEFHDWAQHYCPDDYIFSTENNHTLFDTMLRFSLHFPQAIVCNHRICFRNKKDSMSLECVKEVHMYDDVESIGVVFDIICGGEAPKKYRMIADKYLA